MKKPRKRSPLSPRSILRRTWTHMLARCNDPSEPAYDKYGGKGIRVCERWHDFENFYADMSPRPEGKSLDRYPNGEGNYEPGNVRWATVDEQIRNRNMTRWITRDGETMCLKDWTRRLGLRYNTIQERVKKGWPVELALTLPASPSNASRFRGVKDHCKQGHLYSEHGGINSRKHRFCKLCAAIKDFVRATT